MRLRDIHARFRKQPNSSNSCNLLSQKLSQTPHAYAPHIGGYPPITPFPLDGTVERGWGAAPYPALRLTEARRAHGVSTQSRGDHPSWADAKVRLGGGRVCWRKMRRGVDARSNWLFRASASAGARTRSSAWL